jgi:acetyl esterase/lipase
MKVIKDINYGITNHPQQVLDIYLPDRDEFSVFIYFHGGGLENGSKEACADWVEEVVNKGIAVISAEYRMYPYAKYPEYIMDSAASVKWAFKNMETYGKIKKIFVGGLSAGAYLTMMLMLDKRYLGAHYIKPEDLGGFISGNAQPTTHFNVLRERGINTNRVLVDEAAPLFYIGMEPSYPPLSLIVSDNDIPARYEQTLLTLATFKHFGYDESKIEYHLMEGGHCTYAHEKYENGENKFAKIICEFINKWED